MRCALILLLWGCSHQPLTVSSDGGGGDLAAADLAGGGAPDLAGASCAAIADSVQSWIDGHKSCTRASDCTETNTDCGLPGQCGAYLQVSALSGLMSIEDSWTAAGCTGPCPPCAFPAPATCTNGQCAALGFSDRPVGSPCMTDSQCHTEGLYAGQCLTAAPFTNGDCVLPCAHGNGCPLAGMACRPYANNTQMACFQSCSSDADCRTADGYRCCPTWVTTGTGENVCYPGPCPT